MLLGFPEKRQLLKPCRWICVTCPYRAIHERGTYPDSVYDQLPGYDGTMAEQREHGATEPFMCLLYQDELCGGWVSCHDMDNMLSLKLRGDTVDWKALRNYDFPAAVHSSGADAAAGGWSTDGAGYEIPHAGLLAPGRHRQAGTRRFVADDTGNVACICGTPGCVGNDHRKNGKAKKQEQLKLPGSFERSLNMDGLVEQIAEAAVTWAKTHALEADVTVDKALDTAIRILAVSPYLGKHPKAGPRYGARHCEKCGCHQYRFKQHPPPGPYTCECGHSSGEHAWAPQKRNQAAGKVSK